MLNIVKQILVKSCTILLNLVILLFCVHFTAPLGLVGVPCSQERTPGSVRCVAAFSECQGGVCRCQAGYHEKAAICGESVEFLLQMPCVVTLTTGVLHIIPSSVFATSCMQSAGLSRHLCRLLMHLNTCLQLVYASSPRFNEVTPSSEYKYLVFKYFVLSVDVDDLLLSCTRL